MVSESLSRSTDALALIPGNCFLLCGCGWLLSAELVFGLLIKNVLFKVVIYFYREFVFYYYFQVYLTVLLTLNLHILFYYLWY